METISHRQSSLVIYSAQVTKLKLEHHVSLIKTVQLTKSIELLEKHNQQQWSSLYKMSLTLLQTQYLHQLKWKTFVENSIDFGTAWEFFGADFRTCSFNALLQVLSKRGNHSATEYRAIHQTLSPTGSLAVVRRTHTKFGEYCISHAGPAACNSSTCQR